MPNYKIEWEMYLTSNSPLGAVKECFKDIKEGEALCFTVSDLETEERWSVDLNEDDEDAVVATAD